MREREIIIREIVRGITLLINREIEKNGVTKKRVETKRTVETKKESVIETETEKGDQSVNHPGITATDRKRHVTRQKKDAIIEATVMI